jgi:type VI secretion system protein ImpL
MKMRLNYKLLALLAVLIGVGLTLLAKGGDVGLVTVPQRILAVSGVIIAFLLVVIFQITLIRRANQNAARAEVGSAEIIETQPKQDRPAAGGGLAGLSDTLRPAHGWRWRYHQPWLLLTGDNAAIQRLLPTIGEKGWLHTDAAVLLWNAAGEGGQPDTAWLEQLRKLRRNRPIDAVVLVTDGAVELAAQRRGVSTDSLNLARLAEQLKWSAPVYIVDVADTDAVSDGRTPVIGCEFADQRGRGADATAIAGALLALRDQLAQRGIAQLVDNKLDRYSAELSHRLDTRSTPLAAWIASLSAKYRYHQPIGGAFFAPYPLAGADTDSTQVELPLWRHLGQLARKAQGRRIGLHPVTVFSSVALVGVGIWTTGMLVSGATNAREVHLTHGALRDLKDAPDTAASLRALLEVQHRIELYEQRIRKHPPVWTRFGLNQDRATLAALWPSYAQAANRLLVAPVVQNIEAELVDLAQMQTEALDDQASQLALEGHHALKGYLMLAEPSRADAAFLAPQLARHWRTSANLSPGAKLDLSERLLGFYAQHLSAHPDWRIQPRQELIGTARQTLLAVIVVKNSEDTVYQGLLDTVGNRYPDQTLATLTAGTDPRGLLRTSATVPGVFTRQAYEGTIAADIDKAAERRAAAGDWVLNTNTSTPPEPGLTGDALKAELTARYFADYADAWQVFMNSLQWEAAASMPAAIEQLKPMTDARQSPVIALMKSLEYQGKAGAAKASLSDTLVARAQNVFGKKDEAPVAPKADSAGPLGPAFGPVLRLMAQSEGANGTHSDLSLQRYLDRVTALRLKLQQMSNRADADTQARQVALALFQGKGSDLADIQSYAHMMAASLGAQWAGMGDALFVRPVAQATQTVLLPAQASLNDAWRQTIVATWNQSFAGRYPFASTDNDASLPELARFLRPQGGLIGAFLSNQLAGVLELQGDRWVPAAGSGIGTETVAFDPGFLNAINTLQRIGAHLLVQGEPQYRFDLQPVPTPGLTDTLLTLDGQRLHYYNQRETWQALSWPAAHPQNHGTRLQWQTEQAGTNKALEFGGRWGLVRMLERARVEPIDSATLQLTWQAAPDTPRPPTEAKPQDSDAQVDKAPMAAAPQTMTYPIRYLMRTEVGNGPLELLALRGFTLPERIFVGGRNARSLN